MEIYDSWFDIDNQKTDLENVFKFLYDVPYKIDILLRDYNSNFFEQLQIAETQKINKDIFLSALYEASRQLFNNLDFEREKLNSEENLQILTLRLNSVGFTNNSLVLKAETLNFNWRRVKRSVGEGVNNIIDFAKKPTVKLLRRFFSFLNSILGSLTSVFPGAEAIKEIKEVIESYLGLAEE